MKRRSGKEREMETEIAVGIVYHCIFCPKMHEIVLYNIIHVWKSAMCMGLYMYLA